MFRSPPNKGIILYPAVLHLRCTAAMRDEVRQRGGCEWLRQLITANSRPPAAEGAAPWEDQPSKAGEYAAEVDAVKPPRDTSRRVTQWCIDCAKSHGPGGCPRDKRPGKKKRRVSLDSKRKRRVK